MGNLRIHPFIHEIAKIFDKNGKQVYLVGGAVRDLILGKQVKDWDIATDARPEEVIKLFRRVIPTGIKHGTVTIRYKGLSVETTTFRTESVYSDSRRPDSIAYARTIEEDLSRRDFTMNAIAVRIQDGSIIDPYKGQKDIECKLIRCVGVPEERFMEDGLRLVRGIRFSAQLGFSIESGTLAAIPGALDSCAKVAVERIRVELDKILESPRPSEAFLLMEKTGLLKLLIPELLACRGVEQKGFHRFDVLDHLLRACDAAPADRLTVRLAALLHDIGKPEVQKKDEKGIWTFYRHEVVSARIAHGILKRLRYPGVVIADVVHLIEIHMFHYEDTWTDAAVRRFIVRVGEACLPDVYALRWADATATTGMEAPAGLNQALADRVQAILDAGRALSLKDLAINGEDLAEIGVPRGKRMGILLNELLESVLDDPELNTKERLLEIGRKLNERYSD